MKREDCIEITQPEIPDEIKQSLKELEKITEIHCLLIKRWSYPVIKFKSGEDNERNK